MESNPPSNSSSSKTPSPTTISSALKTPLIMSSSATPPPPSSSSMAEHPPPPPSHSSQKGYFSWRKHDFFPEKSFESVSSYRSAIAETFPRLKDRVFGRSSDSFELVDLRKESGTPLARCLSWWDLIWLSFGSVVGSGIFTITGQEARNHAGPSIVLSYAISGLSALLSVFCYTEFTVEVPVAGGSFSFLRIELGDFVAFIAASNILLEAIVGAAGLGRSWSSYFASLIKDDSDFLRIRVSSFPEGFNLLDPVAVVVLLVANGIAMSGTKRTSFLNWIASVLSTLVIVFIIIVGFVKAKSENLVPFFPFGAEGVFQAAAVVYWSYTGFDMVATMAEETRRPSRDIPIGLVGGMSFITVIYCLMSLSLTMMQKYTDIDVNAPYTVVFERVGMRWAKYLVSIVALKGMTTSLLVGSLGQARYTTQIARAHMIPPLFARVHPKTRTPVNATLLTTILSAVISFFTGLDVLSSVFSFSTLFIFMLMAVALLVRRYYVTNTTSKQGLGKFLACLLVIVGSSIGVAAVWNLNNRNWFGCAVCGGVWFLGTLGLQLVTKQRAPKVWGVPLVPWLPSLSIVMNIFLIGSLGYVAFIRFFACSAVMLLYYVFVGVHATYDVVHHNQTDAVVEGAARDQSGMETKVEEGKTDMDQDIL